MGNLTPGATYIYERVDGVVYAREAGAPANTRIEIGRDYETTVERGKYLIDSAKERALWADICKTAKENPTLQAALEQCIMIYKLSKEYKDGI